MITVETPQGNVQFPDGTPEQTISSVLEERFGSQKEPPPSPSFGAKLASTGADVLSSVAGAPGALFNLAREYVPGMDSVTGQAPGIQDFRGMLADSGPLSVPVANAETPAGKLLQQGVVAGADALSFGGLTGALARFGAGVSSGLSSEAAGQITEGTAAEPYARAVGAFTPALASLAKNMAVSSVLSPSTQKSAIDEALTLGPVSVGDVLGGGASKGIEGVLSKAPISGQPLRALSQSQGGAISENVGKIASQMSNRVPSSAREAGQSLQKSISNPGGIGATQIMDRFSNILYNREVYRHIPKNTAVTPNSSLNAIDEVAGRINNPAVLGSAEWSGLQQVKSMLTGTVNMENLPSIKQQINGFAEAAAKSGHNAASAAYRKIYSSLNDDVVSSIRSVNPQAAAGYVKANEIQSRIFDLKDRLRPYIGVTGDVEPEKAFASFQSDIARRGTADAATLQALQKTLPRNGFNEIRSFMFNNLGIKNDGTFDRSTFVSNWDKLTPESRNILFNVKPEQMSAINRVTKYARTVKPEILNPSGTGAVALEGSLGAGAIASAATGVINPAVSIGLALVPRMLSQGMASQTIAKAVNSNAFRSAMAKSSVSSTDAMIALQNALNQAGASSVETYQILNSMIGLDDAK